MNKSHFIFTTTTAAAAAIVTFHVNGFLPSHSKKKILNKRANPDGIFCWCCFVVVCFKNNICQQIPCVRVCAGAAAFCTVCMQQLRESTRESTHQNRYLRFVLRNSLRAVQIRLIFYQIVVAKRIRLIAYTHTQKLCYLETFRVYAFLSTTVPTQ